MARFVFLAVFFAACTGGPIDTDVDDTGGDTSDTADTGDSADTDTDTGSDVDDSDDEADGIYDDCDAAAAGALRLEPGNYSGTTDSWNQSLPGTCVAGQGAGPEKLFAIDVPTDTRLTIDFRVTGNDTRLYLVENCNVSGVCIASSNTAGGNTSEHLEWVNSSGATMSIYVVLDTRDVAEPGETWTLAVDMESYVPPTLLELADTCTALSGITPISGSDTFAVDLTGFANNSDPGYYGCTGWYASGVDGIVPVEVPDGGTLSASWTTPCDGSLYLLETCSDVESCLAGADVSSGASETFTYRNTTGRDATFALVLDHASGSCVPTTGNPGSLTVTIDPPVSIGADTCASAEALTALGAGDYYVILESYADDLDLADATESCTGLDSPGADAFVPVSVPAGQELRAKFTTGTATDAAVYAVTDCDDANTCVEGADDSDPEELRWINDGVSNAIVYVAIDSHLPVGDPDAPVSGLLAVEIFPPLGDIPLADGCDDLPAIPRVGDGTHVIVMDEFVNNIDLGSSNSCTGYVTSGVDGMAEVRVRPGWTLDVSYNAGCDGAVYLLSECFDATCYDGDDSGNPEQATWTNDTGATKDVIVVMDAYWSCRPTRALPGQLVVDLVPPPSIGADTCAAALAMPSVTEGVHEVDLTDAVADLDASAVGGCAPSAGDEVFVPVTLQPGQAVDLAFDPDQGDPSFYLLEDCAAPPVCLDASDAGNPELLYYFNDGVTPITLVAVVDTNAADASPDEPQGGFFEAYFDYPVVPLTAADACDDAEPVTSGRYEIDLTGFVDDLDLEDGADAPCTDGRRTPGRDAFVEIELPAGAHVDLEWDASISTSGVTNGSIYLLSSCSVDACLVGADIADPEQIDHTNTTGSTQTLIVGVDAYSTGGGPNKGILTVLITP